MIRILNPFVRLVARAPARVQTKLLVAFLTIAALLVITGAGGLRELSGDRTSDVQCTGGCRVAVRATLPWSVYVGAPDPDTNVPILPITFEPFDRLRRQMVGEPFPGD
jgi:hypothetical protein